MGASAAPREASARRWQAGALPGSAALYRLRLTYGRTGAVGVPSRVEPRASGHSHAAQLVSTKALGGGHTRMMTRRGAPQVGQTWWGRFGRWHCGHSTSAGMESLCVARRLSRRDLDVFRLGTAMAVAHYSERARPYFCLCSTGTSFSFRTTSSFAPRWLVEKTSRGRRS